MSPYIISYLIIFIPLVSSLICFLISLPNSSFIISLIAKIFIGLLLFKLGSELIIYKKIFTDLGIGIISIPTEYSIDQTSILFLSIIIFLKIATDLHYKSDADRLLNTISSQQLFYAIELINLFAITGIISTSNIFNLYAYIEIYSFTFYAIVSYSKNLQLVKLSFKYFCHGVIGSIMLLISFLYIYLITNQVNFNLISNGLTYLPETDIAASGIIMLLAATGLLLKFFPFWLYFEKLKIENFTNDFLSSFLLFFQTNIGIYLTIRLLFSLFGQNFSFEELKFDLALIIIGSVIILYSSAKLLRSNNLRVIGSYFLLNNFGFILVGIGLRIKEALSASLLYVINYSVIGLLIFFLTHHLSKKPLTPNITLIGFFRGKSMIIDLLFKIMIFFLISFPSTLSFIANWQLTYLAMNFNYYLLILIPITASSFVFIKLSMKMINYFYFPAKTEKIIEELVGFQKINFLQRLSLLVLLITIISLLLTTKPLNNFINDISFYLQPQN